MQKWQHMWLEIRRWTDYKVVTSRGRFLEHFELTVGDRVLKDQEVFDYIDYLGWHGWELVSASPEISADIIFGHSLWFKRPFIADTTDQPIAGQGKAQAEAGPGVTGQFETGDRVRHPTFGEGIVIESKVVGGDEEVTVAFEEKGVKRLLVSFAELVLLEPERGRDS
jgi:hypothetical protein